MIVEVRKNATPIVNWYVKKKKKKTANVVVHTRCTKFESIADRNCLKHGDITGIIFLCTVLGFEVFIIFFLLLHLTNICRSGLYIVCSCVYCMFCSLSFFFLVHVCVLLLLLLLRCDVYSVWHVYLLCTCILCAISLCMCCIYIYVFSDTH